jgi:membrane protein implicated in regulation of membrane protease activity
MTDLPSDEFDRPRDRAVVGARGTVVVPIPGGSSPGEVRVDVRGSHELLIAYAEEPLEVGRAVLVYNSRGRRDVDVMPDPYADRTT